MHNHDSNNQPPQDPLRYRSSPLPRGFTIDPGTGIISGRIELPPSADQDNQEGGVLRIVAQSPTDPNAPTEISSTATLPDGLQLN